MILSQNSEGNWVDVQDEEGNIIAHLSRTHSPSNCAGRGCAIHNHPSQHPLNDAPINWVNDTGVLERVCEHKVGHPDADAAEFQAAQGRDYLNIHTCDGCCGVKADKADKFAASMRIEMHKGPRPVDVLFGGSEAAYKTVPNPVAPPLSNRIGFQRVDTPELAKRQDTLEELDLIEDLFYAWRKESVNNSSYPASLKDAFRAGYQSRQKRTDD